MATFKIKLEDKAAFLNRMEKAGTGLDTDQARLTRLFFQPLLALWALWSTGAWAKRPRRK